MDYQVSYLSFDNNRIKISLNKNIPGKLEQRARLLKGLHQLDTYGIDFLRVFDEPNQKTQIYFANPAVIKLAARILSKSTIHQLLTYETYEKIDSFYLTILTIRNIELVERPQLPVMYLIHENNDEKTHFDFWNNFVIHKFNYDTPITVSKEECVLKAVLRCLESSKIKLFFCAKKIVEDVNAFVADHTMQEARFDGDEDYSHFKTGIENLVDCESFTQFEDLCNDFKQFWSKEYSQFFHKFIGPRIVSNLMKPKKSNLHLSIKSRKESNYSVEGMIDRNEFSLTDLIIRLYRSSCQFVIESNRAHQEGKVRSVSHADIIESPYVNYLDEDKRKNNFSCFDYFDQSPSVFTRFHFQIADIAINNDLVYLDDSQEMFIVKSPFNESVNTVYNKDLKTLCTCKLNKCFHKIAAKYMHESGLISN